MTDDWVVANLRFFLYISSPHPPFRFSFLYHYVVDMHSCGGKGRTGNIDDRQTHSHTTITQPSASMPSNNSVRVWEQYSMVGECSYCVMYFLHLSWSFIAIRAPRGRIALKMLGVGVAGGPQARGSGGVAGAVLSPVPVLR